MRLVRRVAPPHVLLTAYCAGLLLSLVACPPVWVPGVAVCVALATCMGLRRALVTGSTSQAEVPPSPARDRGRYVVVAGLTLALLFSGLGVGGLRMAALDRSTLAEELGRSVSLTGVLTDLPDIRDDRVTLMLEVCSADGQPVDEPAHLRLALAEGQRFALDPCGPVSEGSLVELTSARVRPLPEARPGRFDYWRYLRRRGEHVLLEGEFADLRVTGRRGGVRGAIDGLRRASRAHLRAGLRGPVRDVLQGMVLGDDEGVDEQVIDDFRRSGLLHIMAVSGENVVLLCGMWSFAFMLLAIPRLARTALLVPVVATYVLLTGASPSIVRAGAAGVVGLLAIMASRPSDGWLLWLAPGAWLLTANPHNIFDVSFQLSFGAVLGLLVLARPLTRAASFLPGPLPEQVGVTMAASLSTTPVSMLAFGSTSLVSVPANVAGGFVLGPIMFLGMLSLLLGFVSSWLSLPLNLLAGLFIGFLLTVARVFGRPPWAVYEWQGLSIGLLLLMATALLASMVWWLARRHEVGVGDYIREPRRAGPLMVAAAAVLAAALVLAPAGPTAPASPTLTFLDVGEGAATLVQVPAGPTVLIDAGPAPLARELRAHAVRRIDVLVLSHGHADHTGGLADIVGRMPVGVALLPQPPHPSRELDRLAADLTRSGTLVRRVVGPQQLRDGGLAVRVLPAQASGGSDVNQNENDNALVVLVEFGEERVLLPGDAEGEALERLNMPRCAVVGVPHHGSAGGFDAGLLADLTPRLAVISVGPNDYGHPTESALELLAEAGVECLRTDESGDVILVWGSQGFQVRAERSGVPPER